MLTGVTTLVLTVVLALHPVGARASSSCSTSDIRIGLCGSTDGSLVTVTGNQASGPSPAAPRGQAPSDPDAPASPPNPGFFIDLNTWTCRAASGDPVSCASLMLSLGPDGEPTHSPAPDTPAITISDVASFAPAPPSSLAEPSNLGVVGRPANFVATASAHTREGSVLGTPVTVRFTPARFTFDYGDGTTATRFTGGASWTDLGQAPFTPTDTSHVYEQRGTYDTTVTVHYTADIDLGTGWIALDGSLPVTSLTQPVRIYEAHTALVHRTCIEDPGAPGC